MRRKNNYIAILALGGAALLLPGCGSNPQRINPQSNQGLITTNDINFKDWQIAAEGAVNSLLQSGVLKRADGRKSVVMVSVVKNSTSQHIDTRIMTDKIRQAILRSGQAVTTTAVGGNGPDDMATKQVRGLSEDEMFNQQTVQQNGTVIAPDMSLAGEIVQQRAALGRTEESYFFFHVTLTDLKTGLAVWEDNFEVAKQGTKPWMGW